MTYLKPILFSAAAGLAFASPAFAGPQMQDSDMKKDAMHETMQHDAMTPEAMKQKKKDYMAKWNKESGLTKAEWKKKWKQKHTMKRSMTESSMKSEVRGAVETGSDMGEILQSNKTNVARSGADDKLLMSKGQIKSEAQINAEERSSSAMDNAITVPTESNPNRVTTVSCPAGTTAQADMTCLVTGNWSPGS